MGSESGSGATMTTSAARLRWAWQDFMACERRVLGAHARPSSVPSSRPVAGRAADGLRLQPRPHRAAGADSPANMQWQRRQDARDKDEREWAVVARQESCSANVVERGFGRRE
jgi:hypothetical protein